MDSPEQDNTKPSPVTGPDANTTRPQSNDSLFGGPILPQALQELKSCFASGEFVACVLLAQVILEKLIAAHLEAKGHAELDWAPLSKLAELALADGLLTPSDLEVLRELRHLRNPYAHTRPSNHQNCISARISERRVPSQILFKEDASRAIGIVQAFLSRRSLTGANPQERPTEPDAAHDGN